VSRFNKFLGVLESHYLNGVFTNHQLVLIVVEVPASKPFLLRLAILLRFYLIFPQLRQVNNGILTLETGHAIA
jgi:hypothetical protein